MFSMKLKERKKISAFLINCDLSLCSLLIPYFIVGRVAGNKKIAAKLQFDLSFFFREIILFIFNTITFQLKRTKVGIKNIFFFQIDWSKLLNFNTIRLCCLIFCCSYCSITIYFFIIICSFLYIYYFFTKLLWMIFFLIEVLSEITFLRIVYIFSTQTSLCEIILRYELNYKEKKALNQKKKGVEGGHVIPENVFWRDQINQRLRFTESCLVTWSISLNCSSRSKTYSSAFLLYETPTTPYYILMPY